MRRRCRRGAPCARAPSVRRRPLLIGGARDPAERTADRAATAAMAGERAPVATTAPAIRREAAPGGPATGAAPATAGPAARKAVGGLGPGTPLAAPVRRYFEARFGRSLAHVRLHEGAAADRATAAVGARAFTLGPDIALARGEATPGVLAHELAHAAAPAPVLRRKLRVVDPGDPIPRPGGKGLKQTNATTIQTYLDGLCLLGFPKVHGSGKVTMENDDTCGLFYGMMGHACACLCDIIGSKNDWRIEIRDFGDPDRHFPHTRADDRAQSRVGGKGSGGLVVVPSPNDRMEYGGGDKTGKIRAFKIWEILAHELCGHARLGDKGKHPKETPDEHLRHGHEEVVENTNKIRRELDPHMTERASSLNDPFCGESFKRMKGTSDWGKAPHEAKCMHLREKYLERMRAKHPKDKRFQKKYKFSERVP